MSLGFETRGLTQAEINQRILNAHDLTERVGARTIKGGAIVVGAQILRVALQILGIAVLARLLAPDQFGLVAMAGAVMAAVSALTALNASTASVQREHLDQDTASGLLAVSFAVAFASLGLAALATPIGVSVFQEPQLTLVVLGLAASAPLNALGSQHYALLMRNMKWMTLQIASVSGFAAGTLAAIVAAWLFDAGYWALVIQSWASAVVSTAMSWALCPWRPSKVNDWSGVKASLRFSLNITATGLLSYVHRQLDNILIGWRWGPTELGFYSRAYNLLMTSLNVLSGPLGSTIVPAMSRLQKEPGRWRAAYLDALAVITIIGGAMACILYGGAAPLVEIVLGDNWGPTTLMFSNLTISMLASIPAATVGWIYISLARTDRMLRWSLIAVPIYVAAFLIGLPFGAAGLALAYSISHYLTFLPCMWMATRQTNITIADVLAVIAPPSLTAVAVGVGLKAATSYLNLWLDVAAMIVAGLLYLTLVAAAVWWLPAYARVRARGLDMLVVARDRVQSFTTGRVSNLR